MGGGERGGGTDGGSASVGAAPTGGGEVGGGWWQLPCRSESRGQGKEADKGEDWVGRAAGRRARVACGSDELID